MWLPDRRFLLLMPLAAAACGFSPAYAPGGAAASLMGRVRAADPTTKDAFDFVERIEERLGRPEDHRYDLTYRIATERVGVGITADNRITRQNLRGSVEYVLTRAGSGERITEGSVRSFTAYSAIGSTVAGLSAEEDAAHRLMRILADEIVTRLIADLANLDAG
ncbi:LPS assembly lipoprotein LptE [Pseudogemmobacter sonorensis]|uniref:LPS assembly lipoprotein LptE n=1 Tax=Pseudogemmobacter sonorensis TaxID=2989681 RepID=UPI0036A118E7